MSQCRVMVSGKVIHQHKVDAYKRVAGPVMKKHNATMPPQSYVVNNVIAGALQPSFMLSITFPDKQQAIAAFEDPEYVSAIADRDEGFGDLSIFIAE